jgi:hypothetical protein
MPKPPTGARWKKGQSGNPTGKAKIPTDVKALAREYTVPAINRLVREIKGNRKDGVKAAQVLLERGWGKPTQPVEGLGLEKLVEVLERRRRRADG